ncbi:MAG: hypothetical protein HQM10_00010 [Candidatus Riflebacteria bacterium]|nr:hypothetical protein [Candidatus Riflebacteria bacterium]
MKKNVSVSLLSSMKRYIPFFFLFTAGCVFLNPAIVLAEDTLITSFVKGHTSSYADGQVDLAFQQTDADTVVINGQLSEYTDGLTKLTIKRLGKVTSIVGQISMYLDGSVNLIISDAEGKKLVKGYLSGFADGETLLTIHSEGNKTIVEGKIHRYSEKYAGRVNLVFETLENGGRHIYGSTSSYSEGKVDLIETVNGNQTIIEGHVTSYADGTTRLIKTSGGHLPDLFDDTLLIIIAQAHRRQIEGK